MSASLQANDTVLPCGQFMKSVHFQKIIPIAEVRSGPFMTEMRNAMLRGEHVDGCQCPAEEAVGIQHTMRQNAIQRFGYTTETKLRKLELVFDNVCNLKCRSCGTPNSHLWYEDEQALYGMSFIEKKYVKNTLYKDIDFTDLENIEVLGGEPIISPGTAEFFKKAKELDIIKNLTIQISTNGMEKPSGHVLTALLECKALELTISIDAYGKYNDYIRSGSNFDQIVANLDYYNNLIDIRNGDTKIAVHTTISIYNVNQLDLLDNCISTKFPRFNKTQQVLQFPVFLSIKNTNQEYKDLVRPFIKNDNVVSYLDSQGEDMFGHFINFSKQLDELRDERIANNNPLLTSYIENYPKIENSKEFLVESLKSIIN
jgi:sulfatase maturation enzyme AslB (radical SAM superfamily)